jgi:Holliday junction resolvase RusA-like endonuclease
VGRPDVDNLAKFVNDVAQGILWGDDSQVVRLTVEKVWAEEDKTTICFEEAI